MNEIDSKTKTLPDKAVATESDDGSLSSLGLQRLSRQRRFHVPTVSLRELVGKKFWVCDFAPDVRTRYGEGRTVVLCKYNRDDAPEKAFKFITASSEIAEIMQCVEDLSAFPRFVTVRQDQNCFYLE